MLKYAAIFAILFVVGQTELTEEQKAKLKQHHQECLAASGVDEALVTKARNGEFTDDAKLKEHMFCVSKKIGFQDDAGIIQKDVLKSKLLLVQQDAAKVDDLITKCAIQKGTPQETAYETIKCYHEAAQIL